VTTATRPAKSAFSIRRIVSHCLSSAHVHITLALLCGEQNRHNLKMREWEMIADKLSKAGWSWGCISAVDSEGRTLWIVDAHRDNGKRFVVRSDELLSAFLELERITHQLAVSAILGDDVR
jgi:hypothetical protein